MKVQVFRTSASSYQDSAFIAQEQKILERIDGIVYIKSLKEMDSDLPFILITNTHTDLEDIPELILKRTLLVIHPNSGFDNFKKSFIEKYSIPIILGNPIRSHAVSEYILSCIFKEITPITNHIHWPESRTWNRKLIRDQKVLIIGHGHIGKILRQSLTPLTRELTCYDPFDKSMGVLKSWQEKLAKGIDILIIAANANKDNFEFIDSKILDQLNSQCLIINPSRGNLIKESDLKSFLKKNKKASAYLDVFQTEPYPPNFMIEHQNLTKTPHIAGVFESLNNDIISFEYLVLNDFIQPSNEAIPSMQFLDEYSECLLTPEKFKEGQTL